MIAASNLLRWNSEGCDYSEKRKTGEIGQYYDENLVMDLFHKYHRHFVGEKLVSDEPFGHILRSLSEKTPPINTTWNFSSKAPESI